MSTWQDEEGVIKLPSGRKIRGRSWKNNPNEKADVSVVLSTSVGYRFGAPKVVSDAQETLAIDWPDFRLPRRPAQAKQTLYEVWERAIEERVEITCAGGVGRTGTALAMLAVFDGMDPADAIALVQEKYHPKACETRAQRAFVLDMGCDIN
ncbi:MAG: protein phosphatase [Actinomycetaceae bacterium]|nr:protein phosphatase [Actinomycetaceae bacterium]